MSTWLLWLSCTVGVAAVFWPVCVWYVLDAGLDVVFITVSAGSVQVWRVVFVVFWVSGGFSGLDWLCGVVSSRAVQQLRYNSVFLVRISALINILILNYHQAYVRTARTIVRLAPAPAALSAKHR